MDRKCLNIKAELGNLEKATGFVESCAEEAGVAATRVVGLAVAFEEAFVNVCNYAYPDGGGEIDLTCSADGAAFMLEIADRGIPFDLLSLEEPDITAGIEDRHVGGLGVFLLKKFTDDVTYCRTDDSNRLTLFIKI